MVIGIHQRSAPVALREQVAFAETDLVSALPALRRLVPEAAIVSTCHRTEIYAADDPEGAAAGQALRFLRDWHGNVADQIAPYLYVKRGADAARHLFRLAAGLDSMVLGEDQILAQLKGALDAARDAGTLGPILYRLLEGGLAAGKLVRAETGIARGHLSAVSVVVDLARERLGGLAARRILVVGAGATGELALKHLRDEPDARLVLANRTAARADVLAAQYGAEPWPFERIVDALAQVDLVLGCTASQEPVISAAMVDRALGMRERGRPLMFCDLAVPRDIDPEAANLPGVLLYDVDCLHDLCAANREARVAEVARAEGLIEGEVAAFSRWLAAQDQVPTIRALRDHAESIRVTEVERALAQLPDLSPHQRRAVEALSASIVNKLLHRPMVSLKDPDVGNGLAVAARRLFDLQPVVGD
ncbi:MAG TPA: glutamyl-tRNA reductase [Chloroflexota bacterium]|nr:glutamyl-tRNA reductase [Chloroflexota bacterium]